MPTLAPQGLSPADAWGFTFVDKWLGKRKIDELRPGVHAHKPQGHDLLASFVRGTARRTWYRGGRLDTWDSVVAHKLKR